MNDVRTSDALYFILDEWAVSPTATMNPKQEIARRVQFLKDTLLGAGKSRLVLGISGGVDSLVAGKLCQLAINDLKKDDPEAQFIAVRLPYGEQLDESDAQAALDFIGPDRIQTVDIKPGVDALHAAVTAGDALIDPSAADFERGNLKARARMAVQYEIAALNGGLVVGTDHNAEAVTGFFTKWGDGACDLMPLRRLNKRQVRLLAVELGANEQLAYKPATADLEDLRPHLLDEQALGLPYDVIDDFLEGKPISDEAADILIRQYEKTEHKRNDPPAAS